jgi:hypothetical protein
MEKRMRRAAAAVKAFMGANPQTPGLAALEKDPDNSEYLIERSEDGGLGVYPHMKRRRLAACLELHKHLYLTLYNRQVCLSIVQTLSLSELINHFVWLSGKAAPRSFLYIRSAVSNRDTHLIAR